MTFNPEIHHRQSIRLRNHDYSQAGAYFVTICVWQRECLFGEIIDGVMRLSETGRNVHAVWEDLPNHYNQIELDAFIVMPNHIHGVIIIVGAGFKPAQGLQSAQLNHVSAEKRQALPDIIRGFKTFSSRRINEMRKTPGCPVWQRNYFERVIRGEREFAFVREYIVNNPLKWDSDHENPGLIQKPFGHV